jgi:23S rRNA pseudouridine1911/1915/1917 synthase
LEENTSLIVNPEDSGMRLDLFLKSRYPEQSRTYFQHLIEENLVLVNGLLVKKREKLQEGDEVEVEFALTKELSLEPENIPLDIIFEDDDIIVINKPPGLVVHPAPGNWSKTFVNALLYHCSHLKDVGSNLRPGIVHRLDKDTTGLLVAAKTQKAHQNLVEAFAQRKVHKEYLAICLGSVKEERIETKIKRHPVKRKEMVASREEGKIAVTHVFPIGKKADFSFVQFVLETGRTHQIRVHMKYKNTPILGDEIYGNTQVNNQKKTSRQLLHAYRLDFEHPVTKAKLSFEAPIPNDFLPYINTLSQTIPSRLCAY